MHRKELLLPKGDSYRDRFTYLTHSAEQIGLFYDSHRVGFRLTWRILLKEKGYKLVGHDLLPLGNEEYSEEQIESTFERVERHRTALTRYDFSAPLQSLARFGFLDGIKTVFDYGCGRGDDLRNLLANNIVASGWDPHYASDGVKQIGDIVNLGFVINVIENLEERATGLCGAYSLAKELLVVSAMLYSREAANGKPYIDGILTARNAFQKYYSQDELPAYVAEELNEVPTPVGPGIFYVFKNKESELRFMYGRQQNRPGCFLQWGLRRWIGRSNGRCLRRGSHRIMCAIGASRLVGALLGTFPNSGCSLNYKFATHRLKALIAL